MSAGSSHGVAVVRDGTGYKAICTCGWFGTLRRTAARADQDTYKHWREVNKRA